MLLFDNIERTFLGYSNHNESSYNYYQRSARKDVFIIRHILNDWFSHYPSEERSELKSRFKKQFDDSFYELFLHELFIKLGFEVSIHPNVPKSTKRPDFLIKKDTLEVYVEAKTIMDKTKHEEALEKVRNEFYDHFSKINPKGFLLSIDELKIKTKRQPSVKNVINYFEKEINQLNPDIVEKQILKTKEFLSIKFENESLFIKIRPIPITPSARGINKRPIGMYPIESFWGGGEDVLKKAIRKKAKRYGTLDKPFIVCVNALSKKTTGAEDVKNAIWGSLALSWSTDPNNKNEKWIRQKDGVFLNENGPLLKNLSGVFVTKLFPFNIPNADYWIFEHPFSENILSFDDLGLVYSYVKENRFYNSTGNDLDKILQIPKDWLHSDKKH